MNVIDYHEPVLLKETVSLLALKEGDVAVDCTLGGGGHAFEMSKKVGTEGRLIGIDRDGEAIEYVNHRLKDSELKKMFHIVRDRFSNIRKILEAESVYGSVSAIIADLGMSSAQVGSPKRGFSFYLDGPLDMRMDHGSGPESDLGGKTAAEMVQGFSAEELSAVFTQYGEEPCARFLAERIVEEREKHEFLRTKELAMFIEKIYPKKMRSGRIHPATKIFQALRIFVNNELGEIETFLPDAFAALKVGGRLGLITFHSLEDRPVKKAFQNWENPLLNAHLPREIPLLEKEVQMRYPKKGKTIRPFPQKPSIEEIARNPRARSAKLRVIEKLEK